MVFQGDEATVLTICKHYTQYKFVSVICLSSVLSVLFEKIATICQTKNVDENLFKVFIHVDVDLFKVALIACDDVEYLTSKCFVRKNQGNL